MKARVIVTLRSGVLDPQGKAIEGALKGLAVDGLTDRKSTRLNSSHLARSRMPSSA